MYEASTVVESDITRPAKDPVNVTVYVFVLPPLLSYVMINYLPVSIRVYVPSNSVCSSRVTCLIIVTYGLGETVVS